MIFPGGHGVVLFSRREAGRGRRGHREPGTVVSADTVGCRDKAQVVGVATTKEDACGLACPAFPSPPIPDWIGGSRHGRREGEEEETLLE